MRSASAPRSALDILHEGAVASAVLKFHFGQRTIVQMFQGRNSHETDADGAAGAPTTAGGT